MSQPLRETERVNGASEEGAESSSPAHIIHNFEHRAYPLDHDPLTIGRDAASDIIVREVAVSRHHAQVRAGEGGYVLHAEGATPTLVNGVPVVGSQLLAEGDKVTVGTMHMTFTRARLPIGVGVVRRPSAPTNDPRVDMRRPTLTHPLPIRMEPPAGRPRSAPPWVAYVGLAAMVGYALWVLVRR